MADVWKVSLHFPSLLRILVIGKSHFVVECKPESLRPKQPLVVTHGAINNFLNEAMDGKSVGCRISAVTTCSPSCSSDERKLGQYDHGVLNNFLGTTIIACTAV